MGWRDKISPKRAWNEAIVSSCIFIVLGLWFLIMSIHHIYFPWERQDFIQFKATLGSSPKFESSRSGPSLELIFDEAPKFVFVIDGDNYNVLLQKNKINELQLGDTLSILVDKSQYTAKISRTTYPSFFQSAINWQWIRIFEFRSDNMMFLSFEDVIRELKNSSKYYLFIGIVILIGTYFYITYEYRIYKKTKNHLD